MARIESATSSGVVSYASACRNFRERLPQHESKYIGWDEFQLLRSKAITQMMTLLAAARTQRLARRDGRESCYQAGNVIWMEHEATELLPDY